MLIARYGVDNPMKSKEVQAKAQQTMLERYNYRLPAMNKDIMQRIIEKSQATRVKAKREHLRKLGIDKDIVIGRHAHYKSDEAIKMMAGLIEPDIDVLKQNYKNWRDKAKELGLDFGSSYPQQMVIDFLNCSGYKTLRNTRMIIKPLELDVYVEEFQTAIEVNGMYWHNYFHTQDKLYHLNKTLMCEERGVQLIHLFEHEILYKWKIVKSEILTHLGRGLRVDTSKCRVDIISNDDAKAFYCDNSLPECPPLTDNIISYGAFYKDKLIACCSASATEIIYHAVKNHVILDGWYQLLADYIGDKIIYIDKRFPRQATWLPSDSISHICDLPPSPIYIEKSGHAPSINPQPSDTHFCLYDCGRSGFVIL